MLVGSWERWGGAGRCDDGGEGGVLSSGGAGGDDTFAHVLDCSSMADDCFLPTKLPFHCNFVKSIAKQRVRVRGCFRS